jgi:hypothetical protein
MTPHVTALILIAPLLPASLAETVSATSVANSPEPSPVKITRYAQRLITRYDTDGSGTLNPEECKRMQGRPAVMDRDQDGQITRGEIVLHIQTYARSRRLGRVGLMDKSPLSGSDSVHPRSIPADESDTQDITAGKPRGSSTGSATRQAKERPDATFHVPANIRPNNLPSWFSQRDRNGDGQLSLAEFAPTRSRESIKTFQKLDTDRDGLLTPQESVR